MLSKLLVPVALAGGALLLLTSKSDAKPKPTSTTTTTTGPGGTTISTTGTAKVPSAVMLATIATTLASADPEKMRALARELDGQGFREQADSLRAAADGIEGVIKATPGAPTPPARTSPPPTPTSATPTTGAAAQDDPNRALAGRVALNIATSSKGREDRELVAAFQRMEKPRGFYDGKIDGLYGPKSAIALARDYGIVPPKPLYWPTNPTPAKAAYRTELLRIAQVDPPRREEWQRAAVV